MKRLLLPVLAATLWAATASAQLPTETLLVALKTDKVQEGVTESIRNALNVSSQDPSNTPQARQAFQQVTLAVEPISIEMYNAYGKLGDSKFRPTELPLAKSEKGGVEIRQLETAEPSVRKWELSLPGDGNPRLSKLTVAYQGEKEPTVYDDPNSTKKGAEVRYSSPGHYVLTLPTNAEKNKGEVRTPQSFTAVIETGSSADPTVSTEKGDWPKSNGYFLVTLKGFPTEDQAKQNFTTAIKDSGQVGGSALKAFNIKKNVSIAVGDALSGDGPRDDESIDGNKYFLKVAVLPKNGPNEVAHKAYVLFPLSREGAEAKVQEFKKLGLYDAAEKTALHIKDNKDKGTGGFSPYSDKDQAPLINLSDGQITPKWYELLRTVKTRSVDDPNNRFQYKQDESSQYFARPVSLLRNDNKPLTAEDAQNLKKVFKDGAAHGVVVYVFDNGKVFNAVPAQERDEEKKNVYAVVRQFDEWGRALKPIANGEPTGDDQPKAPAPKKDGK